MCPRGVALLHPFGDPERDHKIFQLLLLSDTHIETDARVSGYFVFDRLTMTVCPRRVGPKLRLLHACGDGMRGRLQGSLERPAWRVRLAGGDSRLVARLP